MDDEQAVVEKAHPVDVLNRTALRGHPRRVPLADVLEQGATRAGPIAQELDLSLRFAEMKARPARTGSCFKAARIAPNSAGDTEYGACGASECRISDARACPQHVEAPLPIIRSACVCD